MHMDSEFLKSSKSHDNGNQGRIHKGLIATTFDPKNTSMSYASQLRNNGGFFPCWDEENITAPDLIDVISDLDFEGWSKKPRYKRRQ